METSDLLVELECPICCEYMGPPIMQCLRGHSVCSSCKARITRCSICNETFLETRNFSLENIARKVKYPCKYSKSGCELTFDLEHLATHQAECCFSPYRCPFGITDNCTWEGPAGDVKAHIEEAHSDDTREAAGTYSTYLPDMRRNSSWYQAVFTLDELFFHYTETKDSMLYSIVFFVGDRDRAKNYRYEMAFETRDKCQQIMSRQVTQTYCRDTDEVIGDEDCVAVQYSFIKKCMDDDKELPVSINIFKYEAPVANTPAKQE